MIINALMRVYYDLTGEKLEIDYQSEYKALNTFKPKPKPSDDSESLERIDAGDEFSGSLTVRDRRPKWMHSSSDFQKRVLSTCGMNYWPQGKQGKDIRSFFIDVEKAMVSLDSGVVSIYPTEWIDKALDWASGKRFIGIHGLIAIRGFIINDDEKNSFVYSYNKKKGKDSKPDYRAPWEINNG